ncbi:transcription termination/antitermination protein NusG [Leucobacter sp. M11]|uniref:transcription termination/antitermination protein NusG n=1 Tax=Leucobacter sp. M11 TaxID=2993565 RepID=UPI002D7E2A01|nr:transcription termination/antitermination protein NusG [Leucobacter sp. M11]MEB4615189.1 transcription termination/antitermination protein NusG [Leucobacter sp. M11]
MTSEDNSTTPEADLDAALDALAGTVDTEGAAATAEGDDTPAADDAVIEDAAPEDAAESDAPAADAPEAVEGEGDAPAADDAEADEAPAEVDPYAKFKRELRIAPGKWYVIHSYAGYERKVKSNLWNRRETMGAIDDIFEIQVPMEEVMEVKNGQRKMVTRVRIPGYVLVRMHLNENSWSVVRHTPGVTGFVGNAHNPVPLRFNEAFEMLKSTVELEPSAAQASSGGVAGGAKAQAPAEIDFEIGETITIKSGSFEGLPGSISEINPASGKLTVLVSLFERETPVELSFDQVAKLS